MKILIFLVIKLLRRNIRLFACRIFPIFLSLYFVAYMYSAPFLWWKWLKVFQQIKMQSESVCECEGKNVCAVYMRTERKTFLIISLGFARKIPSSICKMLLFRARIRLKVQRGCFTLYVPLSLLPPAFSFSIACFMNYLWGARNARERAYIYMYMQQWIKNIISGCKLTSQKVLRQWHGANLIITERERAEIFFF